MALSCARLLSPAPCCSRPAPPGGCRLTAALLHNLPSPPLFSCNSSMLPVLRQLPQLHQNYPFCLKSFFLSENVKSMVLSIGKEIKDFPVSKPGLSYRLVTDGGVHVGRCGAYEAGLRRAPLALELGWVRGDHTLGHQHVWEGGIGR